MTEPISNPLAIELPTGDVLVVGETTLQVFRAKARRFDAIKLPSVRSPAAQLMLDGRVLLIGGLNAAVVGAESIAAVTRLIVFDPSAMTFKEVGQLQTARFQAAVARLGSNIFIAGGMGDSHMDGGLLVSIEAVSTDTWESRLIGSMTEARFHHSITESHGRLVIVGSPTRNANTTVEIINS